MLDTQFIGLNLHFAVNLFAALVCFAVFWLIYDAWTVRHARVELLKWAGFLALCLGFLLRAAAIQAGTEALSQVAYYVAGLVRLVGYIAIAAGQIMDPLMERPVYSDPLPLGPQPPGSLSAPTPANAPATKPAATKKKSTRKVPTKTPAKTTRQSHAFILGPIVGLCLPLAAGLVSGLYLRRATVGLERHLRPVAWGFAGLTLFELLSDLSALQTTSNPNLYRFVQVFGPVWWTSLAVLLLASIVLGRWVWRYLTKRLQSQLFIILVAQTLVLFLVSTVGFTYLLLQNIRNQTLSDLTTASHVLDYAVASRQAETAAQAEAVAANAAVVAAVAARDHQALGKALAGYLPAHGLTTLTVTDTTSRVLLRGEDADRWGDSRSSDPLVRRAVIGQAASSVVVRDGVVAPTVQLVAAHPVRDAAGTIIGVVITGRSVSDAFVDGVRNSTGLDSAVYGGNIRAATTLVGQDGHDRAIGIKETSTTVGDQVLSKSQSYSGIVSLQNRPYLAAFAPLKDINNVPVGMLLVARPQDALYATANHSVQLTFLTAIILLLVAVYPVYRISRFLSGQLK